MAGIKLGKVLRENELFSYVGKAIFAAALALLGVMKFLRHFASPMSELPLCTSTAACIEQARQLISHVEGA